MQGSLFLPAICCAALIALAIWLLPKIARLSWSALCFCCRIFLIPAWCLEKRRLRKLEKNSTREAVINQRVNVLKRDLQLFQTMPLEEDEREALEEEAKGSFLSWLKEQL